MTDPSMKQHVDHMMALTEHLFRSKAKKGQKPPDSMRPSRSQLDDAFTQKARALAGETDTATARSIFIGEAYPPCTKPLSSLTPIRLRDLTLETHHRGRVLVVRAFSVPNRGASIQNAVEDEFGDVERLAIYNLLSTAEAEDVLPRGAVVAIKEPYYKCTADGGFIVRVDHPSDQVRLKPGDPLMPPALASSEGPAVGLSALELKEKGNAAFNRGDWQKAEDAYSDALETPSATAADKDLMQTTRRNRAMARLRLGRYELARADALDSLSTPGSPSTASSKALYVAGRAAYEMGEFSTAREHLEAVLVLDAGHKGAVAELARTKKRLAEQDTGAYDFAAMAKAATKTYARLDHASFLKNTRVASAGDRGRGLFASKALVPGEVILVEKALHVAHTEEDTAALVLLNVNSNRVAPSPHTLLLQGLVDKIRWNPTLARRYLELYDGGKFGESKEALVVDGQVAVDTFRVGTIASYNGFGCPRFFSDEDSDGNAQDDAHNDSEGIWLRAAAANHACVANGTRAFIGDMMVVRAVKPIRAGEEIFASYESPRTPFGERQEKLRTGYGFDCHCALCDAEAQVPPAVLDKRIGLVKRADDFLLAHPLTDSNFNALSLATRTEAKNILAEVRATYPPALFGRLPRVACVDIGLWDCRVGLGRPWDDLPRTLLVLRDAGYMVTVQDGRARVDRTAAVTAEVAAHAALYTSQVLAAIKKPGAASTLRDLGLEVYTCRFGFSHDFRERFL